MVGEVIGTKMIKTVKVRVERVRFNELVQKPVIRHKNFLVHDPESKCVVGDVVKIVQTPRISTKKHFTLEQIVKPAQRYVDPETGKLHSQRQDPPRRDRAADYGAQLYSGKTYPDMSK